MDDGSEESPLLCRTPQGVRGLKLDITFDNVRDTASHSARSAWIETYCVQPVKEGVHMSHSARSAWIETSNCRCQEEDSDVALRKECVD